MENFKLYLNLTITYFLWTVIFILGSGIILGLAYLAFYLNDPVTIALGIITILFYLLSSTYFIVNFKEIAF